MIKHVVGYTILGAMALFTIVGVIREIILEEGIKEFLFFCAIGAGVFTVFLLAIWMIAT